MGRVDRDGTADPLGPRRGRSDPLRVLEVANVEAPSTSGPVCFSQIGYGMTLTGVLSGELFSMSI